MRAGLQSLEASGRLEDEFDMFALTRGSSLADQRKELVLKPTLGSCSLGQPLSGEGLSPGL